MVDAEAGENVFHKCILCYAEEPYIYNSAIETFKIALRVLKERCISGAYTQLAAEKLIFSTPTLNNNSTGKYLTYCMFTLYIFIYYVSTFHLNNSHI